MCHTPLCPFVTRRFVLTGDSYINLLHYGDAAAAVLIGMFRASAGEVLVASDDQPLTREQLCVQARRAERYRDRAMPVFGDEGGKGKICDASRLRSLGWDPEFPSFGHCVDLDRLAEQGFPVLDLDDPDLLKRLQTPEDSNPYDAPGEYANVDWGDEGPIPTQEQLKEETPGWRKFLGRRLEAMRRPSAGGASAAAADASAPAADASAAEPWLDEWSDRFECWYGGLPLPTQSELASCMGALGLHLGGRLDALAGRAPAAAASPRGCEWLRSDAPQLRGLPDFPEPPPGFSWRSLPLPAIPRLLPRWEQQLQARHVPETATWLAPLSAVAGFVVAGAAVACVARRKGPRGLSRLQLRRRLSRAAAEGR